MIIQMHHILGRRDQNLAGVPNGLKAFAALREHTMQEPLSPELLFLDFKDVHIATASFLRESVLNFRDALRKLRSNFYSVVANANETVREELGLLIEARGSALMICSLDVHGVPSRPFLLGSLDPKQKLTFDLVNAAGETDAAALMSAHGADEGVRQTAWNNRLSALASLGLVLELSQGRAKRYRRLFEVMADGN